MRVAVVAEYYPRRRDPASGAWAHRQAIAARDAGADVHVLVLERPLPTAAAVRSALRGRPAAAGRELRAAAAQPRRDTIDGIPVEYVRFVSPPRERSYARWHRWARRPLARALGRLHAERPLDLVHAHYALPAGGAALPWARSHGVPLAVSVHGGDLLSPLLAGTQRSSIGGFSGYTTEKAPIDGGRGPRTAVAEVLRAAAVAIANSRGMAERVETLAGRSGVRVIHPPGEPPPQPLPPKREDRTVVTLGAIDPRKRHIDVLEALAQLPETRWLVIGTGPERPRLEARARELGLTERIEWAGKLPPRDAIDAVARCHVMAMPSTDEAFGVAYTEALACGVPAIGCAGEPGPEEIAALAPGMTLVPPKDPAALAAAAEAVLADPAAGERAREAAAERFSLATCGRLTLEAYGAARA